MVVYKIVATDEWREAVAAGVFAGASVDRADGFIHFSTAEQAPETAAKWFAGRDDLTLAAVDAEALGAELRWETSRGGALFPHLYAALPMSAVVWARPLPLGPDGRHVRHSRAMRLAKVAGPVLSRLPAETAHRAAINALKLSPPSKAPSPDPRLAVEILGSRFPNPLGLAAGFDKNAEVPGAMLNLGFGFVEVGTLTPRPQDGNARPRLFRLREDGAVINRFGFNNDGFERGRARLARRSQDGRIGVLGVNIGANRDAADRVEDYVLGVKTFAALADYLTINISSPNTLGLRDLQRRDALDDLMARVVAARDETEPRRPLLVKIAPDLDARGLEDIVATALARRIDGLIVSNTTVARPASLSSRQPRRVRGPVRAAAVRAVDAASCARLSPDRGGDAADRLRRSRGRADRARQDRSRRKSGAALHRPRAQRVGRDPGDPRRPDGRRLRARGGADRGTGRRPRQRLG